MRIRAVGWRTARAGLGPGTGTGTSRRVWEGLLGLLAVGIQACGVGLLVLAGSLAAAPPPAGQHRHRRPRHAARPAHGDVPGAALRPAARALP
jgi:hypothetical protein